VIIGFLQKIEETLLSARLVFTGLEEKRGFRKEFIEIMDAVVGGDRESLLLDGAGRPHVPCAGQRAV